MSLQSGRNLGLAASLLTVISPVIAISAFLMLFFSRATTPALLIPIYIFGFAGGISSIILFLAGMRRLADHYRESAIFDNALYGFLMNIIGGVTSVAIVFVFSFFLIGTRLTASTASALMFGQFMAVMFTVFGIIFVFAIVGALFYMRAFNSLAEKSGVSNFKDAGLMIMIGTATTIVFVGIFVVWIGWIMAAIGFYRLRATSTPTYPLPTQPLPVAQKRYCPHCGAPNEWDAKFCKNCGKPI